MMSAVGAKTYTYSRAHRHLEIAALCIITVLIGALALELALNLRTPNWFGCLVALPIGLTGADFASGFLHWLADRYGTPATPVMGTFVRTFREHHSDQTAITRHDFIETNGDSAIWCCWAIPVFALIHGGAWYHAFLLGLVLGAMFTAQIHKWSHQERVPLFVVILQKTGLILSKEHHRKHHTALHDRAYCITNGWLNPFLQVIRFWSALEWLIERWLGVPAQAHLPGGVVQAAGFGIHARKKALKSEA